MSVFIPIELTDKPYFQKNAPIEGRSILLTFRWNERSKAYYVDIAEEDGETLISGVKLELGVSFPYPHILEGVELTGFFKLISFTNPPIEVVTPQDVSQYYVFGYWYAG